MDRMSTVERTDRRILKTRAALGAALVRLLERVPFEQLSIAQIAAEADIARPTFYQHYDSMETLFASVVDAMLDEVESRLDDADLVMPVENRVIMRKILSVWAEHAVTLRVLVENGSRRVLVERFEQGVRTMLTRTVRVNRLEPVREADAAYVASYLANAAVGVFTCWSARQFRESPAEIEALVASLVGPGVERLLVARSES